MSIIKLPSDYSIGSELQIGPNIGYVLLHFRHYYLVKWIWLEWSLRKLWF